MILERDQLGDQDEEEMIKLGAADWIHMGRNTDKWRVLVVELLCSTKCWEFLHWMSNY